MRKVLYGVILLLLLFAPVNRVDVANLLPIRAVALTREGEQLVLRTDTDHVGKGTTVTAALKDLKENTPAVVYLDTAEFLLVDEDALSQLPQLAKVLKSTVGVCVCRVPRELSEAVDYLEVHGDLPKLGDQLKAS